MVVSDQFPQNRFAALDEAQELLGFNKSDLMTFLRNLAKAEDGFLRYSLGDLTMEFMVNYGLLEYLQQSRDRTDFPEAYREKGENLVCISFELEKTNAIESKTYRFSLRELEALTDRRVALGVK